MTKNMLLKVEKVKEIKDKFERANCIVLANYQGIDVEQDTQLRKKMREMGVEYKVYKNRLVKIVAEELGYDFLIEHLEGATSIAFGYDDIISPAKILNDFSEKSGKLSLKVGVVEKEFYDNDKIKRLAKIPSKEVLVSKLLGSIKAPLSNLVYVLNAVKESKES
ncbi:50S ribosomal protein L10 [Candidatus Arthromitus sp. SFB-turkey]|uniref:50S ribosomal protein L10 n=1 Tax=Candidatus Arthromitus sp. SFB-turkey TaxID=1840217 RepID=UPI0007F4A729|nr:50S ribosomal protein L10 [Candidatus Arthromitus sp. SFB-turkey]OAT88295.1 50S ribosomal protein L10 [Candidatus Arthromitus sp. SFB-turkey]HJD00760.1 50S ribosomal protein L10 [Candidatus Dwaynia gallinarum]HJF35262.1 50S ribosomal protein L10 [Clostridium perfringens]